MYFVVGCLCVGRLGEIVVVRTVLLGGIAYVTLVADTELAVDRIVTLQFIGQRDGEVLHRDVTFTILIGNGFAVCGSVFAGGICSSGWL